MKELHLQFSDLRVQMTNAFLPSDKLAAIQSSLRDLSLRVAAPAPSPPVVAPPLPVSSSHLTPHAHNGGLPGGCPPPPVPFPGNPPSFAQVVKRGSNLDRATREHFGPWGVDGDDTKKKKYTSRPLTSANYVVAAVAESSAREAHAPLPNTVRHFFAPYSFSFPHPNTFEIHPH